MTHRASDELVIEPKWGRNDGRATLTASVGGELIHTDKFDLALSTSRLRFAENVAKGRPGIDLQEIDRQLQHLLQQRHAALAAASKRNTSRKARALGDGTKGKRLPKVVLPGGPIPIYKPAKKLGQLLSNKDRYYSRGGSLVALEHDEEEFASL